MRIHDWTLVDAGTFHDFHQAWITHIKEALNEGLLPDGYYAMGEQVASKREPDVLALRVPSADPLPQRNGGVAIAEPKVRFRLRPDPIWMYHRKTRSVVIRHVSGHEVVAMIEIISSANKDRPAHVRDIVAKIIAFLRAGIHVLLVDLYPPGKHDPLGIHGNIWQEVNNEDYALPADEPLTLAAYECSAIGPEAFVEPTAVGQILIDMPIFLAEEFYVNVPLAKTYEAAFRGMPSVWKDVLEQKKTT